MSPDSVNSCVVITCKEFESVPIDYSLVMLDGKLDIFEESRKYVSFTLTKNGIIARSTQYVGVVPINERLTLQVVPRVPLRSLTRIVSWLGMDTVMLLGARTYGSNNTVETWMREILVDAYLQSLEGLRDKGLQREYFLINELGSSPKGRINLSSTARLRAGAKSPQTSYSWYERSVQTAENRMLKAALERSLRILSTGPSIDTKRGMRARIRKLNAMLHTFREVSLAAYPYEDQDRLIRNPESFPDHLSHYRQPIDIARRILNEGGIRLEGSGELLLGTSLLVNMGELFELLIRTAVTRSFVHHGENFLVKDGNTDSEAQRTLYEAPDDRDLLAAPYRNAADPSTKRRMTPDIVINDPSGRCLLIADVKNKPIGSLPDREDTEQVLTYAVRFGVTQAVLFYPRSGNHDAGMQAVGTIGNVRIYQYHYDLESLDLMDEANRLGKALSLMIGTVVI